SQTVGIPTSFMGTSVPRIVHSVLMTIVVFSKLASFGNSIEFCLEGCKVPSFIGAVALQPVPTMRPMAVLLIGVAFTRYAEAAKVATASLVMAAILSRGNFGIPRLL